MAQILIRNLDDAVIEALRQRAAQAGTSIEEEARRVLVASAGLSKAEALERFDAVRKMIGKTRGSTTLDDLRADRRRNQYSSPDR